MKDTIVVNLMGAPSAGKSTIMAGVFSKLKFMGYDCEMVTEFAKDLVWEGRQETFKNELYIFAKQHHRLFRLNGKVDIIITDRPLILTKYYNTISDNSIQYLDSLCLSEFNKFKNINFLINRVKKYNPNGRNQTEAESVQIGNNLGSMLEILGVPFKKLDGTELSVEIIVDEVIKII